MTPFGYNERYKSSWIKLLEFLICMESILILSPVYIRISVAICFLQQIFWSVEQIDKHTISHARLHTTYLI